MFILKLGAEALSLADSLTNESLFSRHSFPPHSNGCHNENVCNTNHNTAGGDKKTNQFLYNLLSGQEDPSKAQSRSQLLLNSSTKDDQSDFLLPPQAKNRSNSLVIVSPRMPLVGSTADSYRPSSVPSSPPPAINHHDGLSQRSVHHMHKHRRHHPYFSSTASRSHHSRSSSPNGSTSTDSGLGEPVDLTKQILAMANIYCGPESINNHTVQTPSPPEFQHPSPPHAQPLFHTPPNHSRMLVHLAKKTVHPVQCHVTTWLRKIVNFVTSPECSPLKQVSVQLRLRLVLASWHQMLALHMAETNFRVVTSPMTLSMPSQGHGNTGDAVPQHYVDTLHEIVELCNRLQLDSIAFDQIRFVIVLIGGKQDLDGTDARLLESYLPCDRYPRDLLHQVIAKLSRLDRIHTQVLFCGHIGDSVEHYLHSLFLAATTS